MSHPLDDRIDELETQLAPLLKELQRLRNLRAKQLASKASALVRQAKKAQRDQAIKQALLAQREDHLYKRGAGLIRTVALRFKVSERTVGRLYADIKPDKYKNSFVDDWS